MVVTSKTHATLHNTKIKNPNNAKETLSSRRTKFQLSTSWHALDGDLLQTSEPSLMERGNKKKNYQGTNQFLSSVSSSLLAAEESVDHLPILRKPCICKKKRQENRREAKRTCKDTHKEATFKKMWFGMLPLEPASRLLPRISLSLPLFIRRWKFPFC